MERALQPLGRAAVPALLGAALLPLGHGLALGRGKFRKTVNPTSSRSVGSRGINDARARLASLGLNSIDHGYRLNGCIIVQTQHHQIGMGHQRLLGRHVLSQSRVDADQLNFRHGLQAVADLQASGSSLAINKYFFHTCSW